MAGINDVASETALDPCPQAIKPRPTNAVDGKDTSNPPSLEPKRSDKRAIIAMYSPPITKDDTILSRKISEDINYLLRIDSQPWV